MAVRSICLDAALVMLSVLLAPVSLAAFRSGVVGAAGAVVSKMTGRAGLATLTFPAASVAVTVYISVPSADAVLSVTGPLSVRVAMDVAPRSSRAVALVSIPVMSKVRLAALVMLSVALVPVSLPTWRSAAAGVAGAVVSMVTESPGPAALGTPSELLW